MCIWKYYSKYVSYQTTVGVKILLCALDHVVTTCATFNQDDMFADDRLASRHVLIIAQRVLHCINSVLLCRFCDVRVVCHAAPGISVSVFLVSVTHL